MPCPEFLRGSGQVLSTAAMPQTNHTRTAGPGLTTTRFADNHHIYRRLGAREPGPGGYGAVLLSGQHRKELSQGFRLTTNNRMELMAVCVALEALKFDGSDVTVYSDSKYVVDAVTKGWLFSWVKKRFAGKKNPDLWMRFLRVYRHHNVRFVWVKGHADTVENNRCDQLAVAAANDKAHLLEDTGYEP